MAIQTRTLLVRAPGSTVKPASAPTMTQIDVEPIQGWSGPTPSQSPPPPEPSLEEQLIAARDSLMARSRVFLAFAHAHSSWRQGAYFKGVTINGPVANGPPGCLKGPSIAGRMNQYHDIQNLTAMETDIYEAIRDGVAEAFELWRASVKVPMLAWYPMFAAFPGPQAPPAPNLPTPLSALTSMSPDVLVPPNLKARIDLKLPQALRHPIISGFLNALTINISSLLLGWIATQIVTGVLGKGPVPTFAPPYVPVGPVLGGSVIENPPIGI